MRAKSESAENAAAWRPSGSWRPTGTFVTVTGPFTPTSLRGVTSADFPPRWAAPVHGPTICVSPVRVCLPRDLRPGTWGRFRVRLLTGLHGGVATAARAAATRALADAGAVAHRPLLASLHTNLAACHVKGSHWQSALRSATAALAAE